MSPPDRYHPFTMLLHWVVFTLFTIMFILGFGLMGGDESSKAFGAEWDTIFDWHATIGLIVLILAIIRIVWRQRTPLPPWAPGLSNRERVLAHWTERVQIRTRANDASTYTSASSRGQKRHPLSVLRNQTLSRLSETHPSRRNPRPMCHRRMRCRPHLAPSRPPITPRKAGRNRVAQPRPSLRSRQQMEERRPSPPPALIQAIGRPSDLAT
jgi:hypothetical protein